MPQSFEGHKKFQCHYRLLLNWIDQAGKPQQEIVTDPVTIDFNVVKTTQSENTTRITIYNLHAATREAIYQDKLLMDNNQYIKWVSLEAGYGEALTLVSWGYIQECYSYRSGVDILTVIDVTDPDILTEYCGVTFEAGTTFKQAYEYLVGRLPSLKIGETGILEGVFEVPTVFNGNTFMLINKLTGGHTFVDNGQIHNLNDNETLSDYGCYYVAADTGLLDTPKRYDRILEISMLFEPTIKIGQLVDLRLSSFARFNGQYKVLGLNHNCIISGADAGSRTTTLQLEYIEQIPNSNENLTANPAGSPASVVVNNKVQPISTKVGSDARAIYEHIKKNDGKLPPGAKITNRISWKEMIYPSGTGNKPQDVKANITPAILQNCINIAKKLTDYVNTHFPTSSITVDSGYRTPQNPWNRRNKEGQLLSSNHLTGKAIDFKLAGVNIVTAKKMFGNKNSWPYGVGVHYNSFIHVSENPRERF